ncbi:hypothetical protein GOBAR_DD05103 [Gossypium barbadense]|nr:hypothetical protein GOBAR_DD05103 [Gossypium barbadense]
MAEKKKMALQTRSNNKDTYKYGAILTFEGNPYYSLGAYSTPNPGASYEIQPLICGFQSELGIQEDSAKAPNDSEELDMEVDEFSDPHANEVPDDVKDEEAGNDYDDVP